MNRRRALFTLAVVLFWAMGNRAQAQQGSATITVDATALSAAQFNIDFGSGSSTAQVTSLALSPGQHTFSAPPSQASFVFTVTSAGTVDFSSAFDPFVSGRGTSTLTVVGFPMRFDATALSADQFNLSSSTSLVASTTSVATFRLLPGAYDFCAPPSSSCSPFMVTQSGTVDFSPSLDGYFAGRGTDTLVALGFAINFDATALSAGRFNLNFSGTLVQDTRPAGSLPLLPGVYTFCAPPSVGCFNFAVTGQGTVDFDAALDGFVAGRGTGTLRVSGYRITIDATALGSGSFQLNFPEGLGDNSAAKTFTLTPGAYSFTSAIQFTFFVTGNGTVDYEAHLDSTLSGRGSNTLVILGAQAATPPTILERLRALRRATDRLDVRREKALLEILDHAIKAVQKDRPKVAACLLGAYMHAVTAAIRSRKIDVNAGHLLILQAQSIMEDLGKKTRGHKRD